MSLRRSPQLTPASLAARRANALRSTGPRTAAGKARSCLNALRDGRRARDLRAKLARIGDSEAVFLLDWFHHHMLWFWRPRKERTWRYTVRLAARAWCFMTGVGLRPRAGETQEQADGKRDVGTYRYGDAGDCLERPQGLRIGYKRGPWIKFLNPTPTRRKHLLLGWLPEFRHVPGPPRKPKRVRRVGPESEESNGAIRRVDSRPTPSRGQALRGNDGMGIEGGTKNLVQTKLECAEESVTCQDSGNTWSQRSHEAVIAPFDDVGATLVVGPDWAGTRPGTRLAPTDTALPSSSCEVTFAEEEPWMFMDPDDDDSEVLEASRALIELQWKRWRQAVSKSKPNPDLGPAQPPGEAGSVSV